MRWNGLHGEAVSLIVTQLRGARQLFSPIHSTAVIESREKCGRCAVWPRHADHIEARDNEIIEQRSADIISLQNEAARNRPFSFQATKQRGQHTALLLSID